ncbi:hypothetical protein SAMN05421835_101594 [Amycolatopsis sacchari]|uniref:Uncharacterized protein n=1 Tax=Amycolatopsis sacchari TaxID=115433 RepID=A0A1I3KKP1_9PSEU|nr:hypothetical protein [Amycolatopsis sacchari]SFI72920.1 hypothetical protein SAMN05421835_101594 [Amycolatopsis sacchari]
MKVVDEQGLLSAADDELIRLFRASPPGEVPLGAMDGTAVIGAGTGLAKPVATLARALAWRGKVFDGSGQWLNNRVGPLGLRAIRATVAPGRSWLDGRDCTVIDYSESSLVARGVRDEIRLVAPGLYLGVVWLWRRRVAWFVLRRPPTASAGPAPHQVALTIRARLRRGREAEVPGLLEQLRKSVELDGGPFRELAGVHFARVFLLPAEDNGPPTLMYLAEVDTPVGAHLRDLASAPNDSLPSLLAMCEDHPDNGSVQDRVRWLAQRRIPAASAYVHHVGRSLARIQDEARLRERIEDFLDEGDWSGADEREVHRAVRAFVAGRPELSWALRPPEAPSAAFRAREAVHRVVVPAAVPLLLPALPVWALLIRRLEARDTPEIGRVSPERLAELTQQEDLSTQNPFTAAGTVKPGLVRAVTLRTVLFGLDYFNRHVYARGGLAGVRTIHFARWVYVDRGRRLVFASNYDGSLESYMDEFIDKLAPGLNAVFSNGVGYPATRWLVGGGARDEQAFKDYLRAHQLPSVWYSAYRDLSARNIDDNSKIREGLSRDLGAAEARSWLALL